MTIFGEHNPIKANFTTGQKTNSNQARGGRTFHHEHEENREKSQS